MRKLLWALTLTALAGAGYAYATAPSSPPAGTPLLLKPAPTDGEAAVWATRFLTKFHYKPMPLDDAMSAQIFKRYLDSLDSDRLFFTQADIDRFAEYQTKLDDAIYDQDLTAPFAIFNLYEQRVGRARRLCARAACRRASTSRPTRATSSTARRRRGRRPKPSSTICGASASRTTGCA